ncbi:MAG: SAM-dependent methyltransferase [Rhabdochlamydiaceae bacterium]|nr:SAM-dependent methyltransferase [Candidatus Amphrikana amoebophyrae]
MHGNEPGLILLPNLLSTEASYREGFVEMIRPEVVKLSGLFIESQKGGRKFMSLFKEPSLNKATLSYLNEHTSKDELDFLLEPIEQGQKWGLISDCGLPNLADPGANLVMRARRKGIKVSAIGAVCSVTAALMLSGLPGQCFTFHGYLPKEEADRKRLLVKLERISRDTGQTQVFIETPYRNAAMMESAMQVLGSHTYFSVVADISAPTEEVVTLRMVEWKHQKLDLEKRPAVFLINAAR